jgi:DNA mismatch repair protein MutS
VPVHAADDYLQKLIALGFRVAVCEQIEDPAEAKKRGSKSVVRRDVIRLVTPGTITEDKLLAPAESNFLMALGRVKGAADQSCALAWIDISTGAFRVAETSHDRLLADILRVDPREMIVAEPVFHDPELKPVFDVLGRVANPQPSSLFDSTSAPARIARFFEVATPDSFGTFGRAELSAISGIIAYVEKTQKAERPPLSRPEREESGATLFIDPATRANLELLRTLSGHREGSLFKAIDRTVTGGGARLLAERLTAPLTDPTAIAARLDSVSFFRSEPRLGDAVRAALKGVADMPRALSRLALNRGGPRDLGALRSGLAAASAIADIFAGTKVPDEIGDALRAIAALPSGLAQHLQLALSDELPLIKRDGGFVRAGYDAELDEMRALRDESRHPLAENPAQQCARLLYRGDGQPSGGDERHGRGQGPLHPPPDHGQCHALHHHRAGGAGEQNRQCRGPCADHRACRVRGAGEGSGGGGANHPRRRGGACRARRLGGAGAAGGARRLVPAAGRCKPRLRDRGRPPSGGRAGVAPPRRGPVRRQ